MSWGPEAEKYSIDIRKKSMNIRTPAEYSLERNKDVFLGKTEAQVLLFFNIFSPGPRKVDHSYIKTMKISPRLEIRWRFQDIRELGDTERRIFSEDGGHRTNRRTSFLGQRLAGLSLQDETFKSKSFKVRNHCRRWWSSCNLHTLLWSIRQKKLSWTRIEKGTYWIFNFIV